MFINEFSLSIQAIKIGLRDDNYDDQVGDVIEIDNFDPSDKECSTGYHFFCTREEAESYYL